MALVVKDRVKQTTTTSGTGSIVLNGSVDGFQTFTAALADGDTTYYAIVEPSTNSWEVGLGTWTEGTATLARTTVLASSNSGSAINLTGQAEVFITQPAEKAVYLDANGDLDITGNITVSGTVDGRDVAADGTKLDGIEAGATADQTAGEIKTAYESNADTNAFTDAEQTKLAGIEAGADVTDTTNVTAAGALMDSELTNITAVKALDQGVATTDSPTFAGGTFTGNVTFGDNDKAIFGAGSDLQIYHDGSNSYVKDNGTGDLYLQGSANVRITNTAGQKFFLGQDNGEAQLYYGGAEKLATKSTGVDVTGTVTADGLTVDGNTNGDPSLAHLYNISTGTAAEATAYITNSATKADGLFLQQLGSSFTTVGGFVQDGSTIGSGTGASGGLSIMTRAAADMRFYTNGHTNERLRISSGGDISFYEGTGTTPKFFWDASAESLGIGTSSPSVPLHVNTSGTSMARFVGGNDGNLYITNDSANVVTLQAASGDALSFNTNGGNERMRIDASGNVGIGTQSPSYQLDVQGAGNSRIRVKNTSVTGEAQFHHDGNGDLYIKNSVSGRNQVFFNDGAERMRIDASGNVGIGTSSPSSFNGGANNLVVGSGSGSEGITIYADNASNSAIFFADTDSTTTGQLNYQHASNAMTFHTNGGTERMRIDANGTITSKGYSALNSSVRDGSGSIYLGGNTGYALLIDHYDSGTTKSVIRNTYAPTSSSAELALDSGVITFNTGTSYAERMRIDSSGNLLVGTTNVNIRDSSSAEGMVYRNGNSLDVNRSADPALILNRLSSDGNILLFRKDAVDVGSISTRATFIRIGKDDTGLEFHSGDNTIYPANIGTGGLPDGTLNLGSGSYRFKDLHLSGVGYVGTIEEANTALSGTTPSIDADTAGSFTLTTSGNTTFTFASVTSGRSVGFVLKLTAGGSHTITWPASVDWAGGTAPDAPASGETDVLVFYTVDGGTTWYGVQSIDAAA